jgi:hypothetical protein
MCAPGQSIETLTNLFPWLLMFPRWGMDGLVRTVLKEPGCSSVAPLHIACTALGFGLAHLMDR